MWRRKMTRFAAIFEARLVSQPSARMEQASSTTGNGRLGGLLGALQRLGGHLSDLLDRQSQDIPEEAAA